MSLFDDDDFDDDPDGGDGGDFSLPEPDEAAQPCIGHGAIEARLLDFYNSGRMPHAMIFAGVEGIGKAMVARRLVKFLMTHKPAGADDDAGPSLFGDAPAAPVPQSLDVDPNAQGVRLVESGGHPDVLMLGRKLDEKKGTLKDGIDVEQVRQVAPFLQLTPSMGGWRVVVIDDADTMNRNAQNALLKVLEEPPANAVLILIAHRPGALIPTIRSRSRMMNFTPLIQDDFNHLLRRAMPTVTATDMQALYNIAGGSIGHALRLMQDGALKSLHQLSALLEGWPTINWDQVHMTGEVLGGRGNDEAALQGFQDVMLWAVAQMTLCRARGASLPPPLNDGPYPALLSHFTLEQLSRLNDDLRAHFATVKYGALDKRQAVFGAFSILEGSL